MDALDKVEKSVSEKIKSAVTANTVMTCYLSSGFRNVGFTGACLLISPFCVIWFQMNWINPKAK